VHFGIGRSLATATVVYARTALGSGPLWPTCFFVLVSKPARGFPVSDLGTKGLYRKVEVPASFVQFSCGAERGLGRFGYCCRICHLTRLFWNDRWVSLRPWAPNATEAYDSFVRSTVLRYDGVVHPTHGVLLAPRPAIPKCNGGHGASL
jgi:hypothetical protein